MGNRFPCGDFNLLMTSLELVKGVMSYIDDGFLFIYWSNYIMFKKETIEVIEHLYSTNYLSHQFLILLNLAKAHYYLKAIKLYLHASGSF